MSRKKTYGWCISLISVIYIVNILQMIFLFPRKIHYDSEFSDGVLWLRVANNNFRPLRLTLFDDTNAEFKFRIVAKRRSAEYYAISGVSEDAFLRDNFGNEDILAVGYINKLTSPCMTILPNFPAVRPSMVKGGVPLTSNLLQIKLPRNLTLHHYTVAFDPIPKRQAVNFLWEMFVKQHPDAASSFLFDGTSIAVSTVLIPNVKTVLQIGKERECTIDLTHKNTYDYNEILQFMDIYANNKNATTTNYEFPDHIQALEVVLKAHQKASFYTNNKQIFGETERSSISKGMEVFTGLTHSLKLCQMGLVFNVDLSFGVFFADKPLIEFIKLYLSRTSNRPSNFRGNDRNDRPDNRGGDRPGQIDRRDFRERHPGQNDRKNDDFRERPRFDRRGGLHDTTTTTTTSSDSYEPHPRFHRVGGVSSAPHADDASDIDADGMEHESYNVTKEQGSILPNDLNTDNDCIVTRNERPGGDIPRNNRDDGRRDDYKRRDDSRMPTSRYGTKVTGSGYGNRITSKPDLMSDEELARSWTSEVAREIASVLRKVKVSTTHIPQRSFSFFCDGISLENSDKILFKNQEGVESSVASYFAKTYGPLKFPKLPCVIRKKKNRDDCYFPFEVLKIAPLQQSKKKLDENQTSQMIRIAAKPPHDRFQMLKQKVTEFNITTNPVLTATNIQMKADFLKVEGRELTAPALKYRSARSGPGFEELKPVDGSWNVMKVGALNPVVINSWAVVYLKETREVNVNRIDEQLRTLIRTGENFGMKFASRYAVERCQSPADFSDLIHKNKFQLVLVILPSKAFDAYKEIKHRSESLSKKFTITQCMVSANFPKLAQAGFCANLLLKINVKLLGVNWKLATNIIEDRTMVLGADVSHPGVGDLVSPSIVAVTGSYNSDLTKFRTTICQQERRKEVIHDMNVIIRDKLNAYNRINGHYPDKIIFFRDGVGESQFHSVFTDEIKEIQKATLETTNKKIKLTYIIVQKRHAIKLMNEKTPKGNPNPGTVCDSIGALKAYDFYIVSHYALQGTAKPVRYQVLYDENAWQPEKMHDFVHRLSYLYPRATKAVSVVPPIYFAHLAAARAKCYMRETSEAVQMSAFHEPLKNHLFYL